MRRTAIEEGEATANRGEASRRNRYGVPFMSPWRSRAVLCGMGMPVSMPMERTPGCAKRGSACVPRAVRWFTGPVLGLTVMLLSGCSLLSIKTPEIPLSPREQEARILTREYAAHFIDTVVPVIDEQSGSPDASDSKAQRLRLKLAVVTDMTRASTGLSPIGSLLDTWALALQFRDLLMSGPDGERLVLPDSDSGRKVAALAAAADELGRSVLAQDFPRYHEFVLDYVRHNPLAGAEFTRPSILSAWTAAQHDRSELRSAGTVAQALNDVSDRVRIYGERLPTMTLWEAEAELDRAGFDNESYRTALRSMDSRLERISTLAETGPRLAHEAIADLRESLRASSERLDHSWMKTIAAVSSERAALAENIATERASLVDAVDLERARLSSDADRIVARSVETSWQQLRQLIRESLMLIIVLAVVMLGMPFAAGYLLGRRMPRREHELPR